MAKLWCPICKLSLPSQADINNHLQRIHNHPVKPQTEHLYRRLQSRKWKARKENLDVRLCKNRRAMRLEWEKFANHPSERDVPTNGMDEDVVQEMMLLQEIDDDASSDIALLEDESETEDVDVLTTPTLSAGTSSSCSSDSGRDSSDKERVKNDDMQSKLAEFGTVAHDNKTQRRSGQPLDKIQQKLTDSSPAMAGDPDDDQGNDADDEGIDDEEGDDADHELQTIGDDDQ